MSKKQFQNTITKRQKIQEVSVYIEERLEELKEEKEEAETAAGGRVRPNSPNQTSKLFSKVNRSEDPTQTSPPSPTPRRTVDSEVVTRDCDVRRIFTPGLEKYQQIDRLTNILDWLLKIQTYNLRLRMLLENVLKTSMDIYT